MHVPPDCHVAVDPMVAGPPTLLSVPTQFPGRRQCQRLTTEYFSSTGRPKRSPKVSFMSLPRPNREKIYSEANVAQGQFIDLNFLACERRFQDHDEDVNDVTGRIYDWLSEQRFPVALLRASRLVHSEVEAMLYSTNTFAISLPSPDGLRPLETLSATAIKNLTRLVVSLRTCRCIIPNGCSRIDWGDGINVFCSRPTSVPFLTSLERLSANTHDRPLGHISRTEKNTLARWQRICGRLSVVRPGQLWLYVVANVADLQTAHAILCPLRSIPVLDVAISLGDKKDAQLHSLARNSVLAQMNKLHYPPFRFLDLPLELQVQILLHTNLVATHGVAWDPSERFCIIGSGRHCWPHPGAGTSHIKWGVFCAARHAAFNVRCECRDLPLNYFLVRKAFAVTARYVYYARNEFRLFPSHSFFPDRYASDADDDYYQLSLQSFLRRMPPEGIRNLEPHQSHHHLHAHNANISAARPARLGRLGPGRGLSGAGRSAAPEF